MSAQFNFSKGALPNARPNAIIAQYDLSLASSAHVWIIYFKFD
mgnify:CR=1 FL=1|jgi:hypothetical protein